MKNLGQPFVPVGAPFVDPQTGMLTTLATQFLLNTWQRTNGAAGPMAPLTGSDDEAMIAFFQDADEIAASTTAANSAALVAQAAAADALTVALMSDDQQSRSDDQAALLAQLLAD